MTDVHSADQVDRLLRQLSEAFLLELPEQCDRAEQDLLILERSYDQAVFNRLFGLVHSIKGSGGTHGFPVVTSICHQFESVLAEWQLSPSGEPLVVFFGFIDLLRQAAQVLLSGDDISHLKQQLENLRLNSGQQARRVLVVESSRLMRQLCQQVSAAFRLQVDLVDDGLEALRELLNSRYDCLIIGRQLKTLNGAAVVSALREAEGINCHIPVLMISSDKQPLAEHLEPVRLLPRTPALTEALAAELEKLLLLSSKGDSLA